MSYKTLRISEEQMEIIVNENSRIYRRVPFLVDNLVEKQLNEIYENEEFFIWCIEETGYSEFIFSLGEVSNILFWIIFMSNENIVKEYNKRFNKGFLNMCPMSDIVDLYIYMIYMEFYKQADIYKGLQETIETTNILVEIDKRNIKTLEKFIKSNGGFKDKEIISE